MRVLVSGSSGLVGSALVPALERDGHEVVRLRRLPPGEDRFWVDVPPADAVVHLAGEGIGARRWNPEHKRRVLESRVAGTTELAERLAALPDGQRPRVLVSASAVGYYGDRGDEVLTEESPAGAGFVAEVCQRWEACTSAAEAAGIRVARVRSGLVMAAHGGVLPRQMLPFRFFLGARLGTGRQWVPWIALDDEVRAIAHVLADERLSGPVNLTSPNPVTNALFSRELGWVLARPVWFKVPAGALRLALGREMADELLLISQRVLPARLTAAGFELRHPELEGALRAVLGR